MERGTRRYRTDTKRRQENHPAIKHLVGFVLPGGAMCTKWLPLSMGKLIFLGNHPSVCALCWLTQWIPLTQCISKEPSGSAHPTKHHWADHHRGELSTEHFHLWLPPCTAAVPTKGFSFPSKHSFISTAWNSWFLLETPICSSLAFPARQVLQMISPFFTHLLYILNLPRYFGDVLWCTEPAILGNLCSQYFTAWQKKLIDLDSPVWTLALLIATIPRAIKIFFPHLNRWIKIQFLKCFSLEDYRDCPKVPSLAMCSLSHSSSWLVAPAEF